MSEEENKRYFFNFSFFKIDPKWRWMADLAKEESARELENVLENLPIKIRTYSTLGLRDDADFLIWSMSESIEDIQEAISKIYLTVVGKYITPSRVYLSSTRQSMYAKKNRIHSFVGGLEAKKYVIVYPFIKTREWYLLPIEQRRQMMDEHIKVGEKYPQVELNTTYSFGIHDQDFMLAFESDDLSIFQDMIMDLRGTKVSRFVKEDTPMIVCVKDGIVSIIKSLG
jgi:chlorite dismutase